MAPGVLDGLIHHAGSRNGNPVTTAAGIAFDAQKQDKVVLSAPRGKGDELPRGEAPGTMYIDDGEGVRLEAGYEIGHVSLALDP